MEEIPDTYLDCFLYYAADVLVRHIWIPLGYCAREVKLLDAAELGCKSYHGLGIGIISI